MHKLHRLSLQKKVDCICLLSYGAKREVVTHFDIGSKAPFLDDAANLL